MSSDVGTLKNQMQRAYPDNSTIGENPWSSKNIVDMLCPPLEESGNPVACYPVAGYPLGVKAKWEPMQEGGGTPSPENIRPIKGRDSVTVTRCWENLSATEGIDNVRWATTYVDLINVLNKLPSGTYVLNLTFTLEKFSDSYTSDTVESTAFRFSSQFEDDEYCFISRGELITKAEKLPSVRKITKTFVITPQHKGRVKTAYFYACGRDKPVDGAPNGALGEGKVSNVTITLGTTAPTTYTPYIGQTNTLTLPETVYGGEVDAVSGDVKETWKTLTLDGTENWIKWESSNTALFANAFGSRRSLDLKAICSHIMTTKSIVPWTDLVNRMQVVDNAIGVNIAGKTEDVETWKSYLAAQYAAGTPVQICYVPAKHVPFTATGAQPLPALAGVNTVLTDADSAAVTGRADPIKRITDLEDATASQT